MGRRRIIAGLAWAALVAAAGEVSGASLRADKAAVPAPAVAIASSVEASGEGQAARLTVSLSKPVVATAFVMERPNRVVIDLPEVAFHMAGSAGKGPNGVIASFRYGLFAPGRSRIVVDLAQPALVSRIEVERHPSDGSARLVLDLAKTDAESFRKAAAKSHASPQSSSVASEQIQKKDPRPLVMLDPGHGGIDPGAAAAGGMVEKDIVFAFAERLKKRLEAAGRYRVALTREQDVFVSLPERVRLARAAGADLFISIHADSISGAHDVRGLTVYTGSERASDSDSAKLAARENEADAAAGVETRERADEVVDILQDLTLRETRSFSHAFATRLVGELDGVARLNKNPHREAGFRVLRAHDVPSVLVELGYLSSRKDIDLLMSDEWRDRSTAAMVAAIDRFFAPRMANGAAAPVSP